ncbi:hypothetical protein FKW77_005233 [Venturia effusa]|uniref:Uncharacterized protein n=1 Tax=Venturia effusa TaxID=50376 RepID=A0A517KWB3_9PEZI|nr:hypothetical protein FKW77_005233 [Venturia effusa]
MSAGKWAEETGAHTRLIGILARFIQKKQHTLLERAKGQKSFTPVYDFEVELGFFVLSNDTVALVNIGGSAGDVLMDVMKLLPGLRAQLLPKWLAETLQSVCCLSPVPPNLSELARVSSKDNSAKRFVSIEDGPCQDTDHGDDTFGCSDTSPRRTHSYTNGSMGDGLQFEKQWRALMDEAGSQVTKLFRSKSANTIVEAVPKIASNNMKSFNIKAIVATLVSLLFFAKADDALYVTLCNNINYGGCQDVRPHRYRCYTLDKATMAVSSIKFSGPRVIACQLFEGTDCTGAASGWLLKSNPNLGTLNYQDVGNSYMCQIHNSTTLNQAPSLHSTLSAEQVKVTTPVPISYHYQLTNTSSKMQPPSKMLAVLAAVTLAFPFAQHVKAAPAHHRSGVVQFRSSRHQLDEPIHNPVHLDLCAGYYLENPCTFNVVLPQGKCVVVPRNAAFSSLSYNEQATCTLFTGKICDAVQAEYNEESIVLPYDVISDLSRVGWAKKVRSIYCKWSDAAFKVKGRSSLSITAPVKGSATAVQAVKVNDTVPRTAALAHHRDHDLMHITLYDKIQFEDDGTPGSGYEFVMEPNLCIKLRDVQFERKTSSIKFERGPVCTFFANGDCNGGPTLVLAIQETNLKPFHTDDWKTWNDRISFSCQWKNDLQA